MKIVLDQDRGTLALILDADDIARGFARNNKGHTASSLAACLILVAHRFEDATVYDGTNMPVCEVYMQDAEPGCPDRIMVG